MRWYHTTIAPHSELGQEGVSLSSCRPVGLPRAVAHCRQCVEDCTDTERTGMFDCLQLSMRSGRREVSDVRDMKKRRQGEMRATKVTGQWLLKQGPGK